jgi:hypothetical protein
MVDGQLRGTVLVACGSCEGQGTGRVYETIVDGRLHWVLSHDCTDGFTESMGWDETPEELRQAILAQCGTYRLRVARKIAGTQVAVMKVLRSSGVEMGKVSGALAALNGEGMPGTEAELELLARHLRDADADAVVEHDG